MQILVVIQRIGSHFSSRQGVNDMELVLMDGRTFIKHGHMGNPHIAERNHLTVVSGATEYLP